MYCVMSVIKINNCTSVWRTSKDKDKDKVYPTTGHEGP